MRDAQPKAIYLKNYQPPEYLIPETRLHFELHEEFALVHATLRLARRPGSSATSLRLHGEDLELLAIALNGRALVDGEYAVDDASLTLTGLAETVELQTTTRIRPQDNTALEGLYKSRAMFCTQCEAEGFRKITYFLDRPDVMSVFSVTIDADLERYPVLLSNGNRTAQSGLADARHRVVWEDPFPKPAYLFALVAGDLARVEDTFTTMSGRSVVLRIYVEEKDLGKCDHAMQSLKHAMRWDEEVYGREYDLDIFNIVAVDDFNMGAMENKSLNIFNTSCILASPETTTDVGFERVESIVAHEYFHNWSGNRVTCRDWFQLSLKEGFTVFRDAEFSADRGARDLKRIEDATLLRTAQFAEDGGPMAHPVRPDSFIEISNFYTLTVYEKGAAVVRMIHTLLGPERFRAGSDLYFERHDGQAVTCDDFVDAMQDSSGVDLSQFRRWYSQAGTPELAISGEYDADARTFALHVTQSCPATPGQPDKLPLVIPLAMGLLGDAGNLRLQLQGEPAGSELADNTHRVLEVNAAEQSFLFTDVPEKPVPSLLRGFSAPVRVRYDFSREDLCALMMRDGDGFARWDAGQQLMVQALGNLQTQRRDGEALALDPLLVDALGGLLRDEQLEPAVAAAMLALPGENTLAELASHAGGADVEGIHAAREHARGAIAGALGDELAGVYRRCRVSEEYAPVGEQIGRRTLANVCLSYLATLGEAQVALAATQLEAADNLTDRLAALQILAQYGEASQRESALQRFYDDWSHETLVVNQWLQLQAMLTVGDSLERVRALMEHPAFTLDNPNKVRAVVGAFASGNPTGFHRADGAGYGFLGGIVEILNRRNPQMAARLLVPLTKWRNYPAGRDAMREELQRLAALPDLSPDVYEVVSKSLA
ncbi:aminopeptidase N [Chromatocurvus halotolerans]|uniref:Aminopeptidase N n=1 Tax=Chromatocurvus halotolerans TaxID=1132028 RepID=A0A4R2KS51_9GAMM|nr:aminopeptidase N [Chromatocurvus halotolerans]TCO75617.1 aminopeptidase N [Chromatocurvus halotolerans]